MSLLLFSKNLLIGHSHNFYIIDNECMRCGKYLERRKFCFIQALWLDTVKGDKRALNAKNEFDNYIILSEIYFIGTQ